MNVRGVFLGLLVFLFLLSGNLYAQNAMKKGFEWLEQGEFVKARAFFGEYLKGDPENFTARICYGRALGLSGELDKSYDVLTRLLADHPGNFEVRLNLAEYYMWAKNPSEAKSLYSNLLKEDSLNFTALLGMANALSQLKEYSESLAYLDICLTVSPGQASALTSKKFTTLAYSDHLIKGKHFKKAESLMKPLVQKYPQDASVLHLTGIMYLSQGKYNKAAKYLAQAPSSIQILKDLNYANFMAGKERKALRRMEKLGLDSLSTSKELMFAYSDVLAWNRKFKAAYSILNKITASGDSSAWKNHQIKLKLWEGSYEESLVLLKTGQNALSSSARYFIRVAERHYAQGELDSCIQYLKQAHAVDSSAVKEAKWSQKAFKDARPSLDVKAVRAMDNGGNTMNSLGIEFGINPSLKNEHLFQAGVRNTLQETPSNQANLAHFGYAFHWKASKRISAEINPRVYGFQWENTNQVDFGYSVSARYKISSTSNLNVLTKSSFQDYNAALIKLKLRNTDYGFVYTNFAFHRVGTYVEYLHTRMSDANVRNLAYGALYGIVKRKPALKMGISGNYMTFQNQLPELYFSPEKYWRYEVFLELNWSSRKDYWGFRGFAAYGQQLIEDLPAQAAQRAEAAIWYKSGHFDARVFGSFNNAISGSNSVINITPEYRYLEFGVQCTFYLGNHRLVKAWN